MTTILDDQFQPTLRKLTEKEQKSRTKQLKLEQLEEKLKESRKPVLSNHKEKEI